MRSRSTARSTGVHERAQEHSGRPPGRPPGRPTDKALISVGPGRPARSTVAWVGRLAGRLADRQMRFLLPFGIQIPFLDGIESNLGFLKSRDSMAINKGQSPHVLCP